MRRAGSSAARPPRARQGGEGLAQAGGRGAGRRGSVAAAPRAAPGASSGGWARPGRLAVTRGQAWPPPATTRHPHNIHLFRTPMDRDILLEPAETLRGRLAEALAEAAGGEPPPDLLEALGLVLASTWHGETAWDAFQLDWLCYHGHIRFHLAPNRPRPYAPRGHRGPSRQPGGA